MVVLCCNFSTNQMLVKERPHGIDVRRTPEAEGEEEAQGERRGGAGEQTARARRWRWWWEEGVKLMYLSGVGDPS